MSRKLYLKRKSRFIGSATDWRVFRDKDFIGHISNNENADITVDDNEHRIYFEVDEPNASGNGTTVIRSNTVLVPFGNTSHSYILYFKMGLLHNRYIIEEIRPETVADEDDIQRLIEDAQRRR